MNGDQVGRHFKQYWAERTATEAAGTAQLNSLRWTLLPGDTEGIQPFSTVTYVNRDSSLALRRPLSTFVSVGSAL